MMTRMSDEKLRILFLCTGNSCRSQMAEALLRRLAGDKIESLSAGSNPAGYVHPKAIAAMRELGIDLSAARSKSIEEFLPPTGEPPDVVISVCDSAARDCPTFPGDVKRLHWPFEDPAHAVGTEEVVMGVFRRVRDEIRAMIEAKLGEF
jgi:arsenate reductase